MCINLSNYLILSWVEGVDKQWHQQPVQQMVSQHCVECGYVKTQDIIEVVKVIQVLGDQVCQASSAAVAVLGEVWLGYTHTQITY